MWILLLLLAVPTHAAMRYQSGDWPGGAIAGWRVHGPAHHVLVMEQGEIVYVWAGAAEERYPERGAYLPKTHRWVAEIHHGPDTTVEPIPATSWSWAVAIAAAAARGVDRKIQTPPCVAPAAVVAVRMHSHHPWRQTLHVNGTRVADSARGDEINRWKVVGEPMAESEPAAFWATCWYDEVASVGAVRPNLPFEMCNAYVMIRAGRGVPSLCTG